MTTKLNETATCPYCGKTSDYIFHYGSDSLYCHHCEKEFAIKLETKITIISKRIYDKQCIACNGYFFNEEIVDGKCPNCGCDYFEENEYRISEFDR